MVLRRDKVNFFTHASTRVSVAQPLPGPRQNAKGDFPITICRAVFRAVRAALLPRGFNRGVRVSLFFPGRNYQRVQAVSAVPLNPVMFVTLSRARILALASSIGPPQDRSIGSKHEYNTKHKVSRN